MVRKDKVRLGVTVVSAEVPQPRGYSRAPGVPLPPRRHQLSTLT